MTHRLENAVGPLASLAELADQVLPYDSGLKASIDAANHSITSALEHVKRSPNSPWVGVEDPTPKTYTREEAVRWAINNAVGDLESFAPEGLDLTDAERTALLEALRAESL